ncbi:MAG: hypothetical protein V3V85_03615, partial [Candidatus Thorarchaeota archaeon]
TNQTYEVPTGKRWYLLGGTTNRDVSGDLVIVCLDTSGNVILELQYEAAGTGSATWPSASNSARHHSGVGRPMVLDAGEQVDLTFGAAQGAGAYASCVVLEVNM